MWTRTQSHSNSRALQFDNAQRATTQLTIRYTDKTFLKSVSILFYTMVEKYKKIGKWVLYL